MNFYNLNLFQLPPTSLLKDKMSSQGKKGDKQKIITPNTPINNTSELLSAEKNNACAQENKVELMLLPDMPTNTPATNKANKGEPEPSLYDMQLTILKVNDKANALAHIINNN